MRKPKLLQRLVALSSGHVIKYVSLEDQNPKLNEGNPTSTCKKVEGRQGEQNILPI
jgi:hypothetical protein